MVTAKAAPTEPRLRLKVSNSGWAQAASTGTCGLATKNLHFFPHSSSNTTNPPGNLFTEDDTDCEAI
jgi:hypothetical protein